MQKVGVSILNTFESSNLYNLEVGGFEPMFLLLQVQVHLTDGFEFLIPKVDSSWLFSY